MIARARRSRSAAAVIVVRSGRVVRHDAGDAEPIADFEVAASTPLAQAVDDAIGAGPRPRRVLVVTDHVHTQTLELAHKAVDGLDDGALAGALAYEVEPLCGVSARTAALGIHRLHLRDGRRTLWTIVLDDAELHAVDAVIARHGAASIGVAPCVGWLRSAGPWIHVGAQATACGQGDAVELVLASRPEQRSWTTTIGAWSTRHGDGVQWLCDESPPRKDSPADTPALGPTTSDPGSIVTVARKAALELASGGVRSVPVVRPRARPTRRIGPLAAGILATALTCAFVGWDAWTLAQDVTALERDAADATRRAATMGRRNAEVVRERQALERVRGELATARALADRLESGLDRQHARFAALLDATWRLVPESLMLRAIAPDVTGVPTLTGIALEPGAVDAYSDALDRELSSSGWRVRPAVTERGHDLESDLYAFRIAVVPSDDAAEGAPP